MPHHVITAGNNEQKHCGRSSVLDLHDLAIWVGLPPDGRPPHLTQGMLMIILPAPGRRLWNTLRRTPSSRTRPLDGARRVYASSEHERREQSLSMACATSRGRRVPRPRRRSDRVLPKACGASLSSGAWSSTRLKSRKAVKSLSTACARSGSSRVQPPCRGSRARAKKGRWYSLFRAVRDRRSSGSGVSRRDDDGGGSGSGRGQ